ncbi:hypothetical protein S83_029029, partial [Arachis hypogaea]
MYGSLNSDRVLCHFCFKPKKVTNEALSVDHAKKSQVLVSSVILLKTTLDALPLLSKVSAVKCGRIQVDGERVPVSYIVKSSQKISHFVHRHEPPVIACEVPILQKELDVLTVCRPASVPCEEPSPKTPQNLLNAVLKLEPTASWSCLFK